MKDIIIKLLDESDTQELFIFESENKAFFEKTCLPRDDNYYEITNFSKIVKQLVNEQEEGLVYMYLIYNTYGKIIGRVNLVSIIRESFNKAELGYRIGEKHQGKGYATTAVKFILDEAINKHNLNIIEAGTSPDNIGSQIVLIKNGFKFSGRTTNHIYLNGKWCDSINFKRALN